jgi:Tol biopolymer transport system component
VYTARSNIWSSHVSGPGNDAAAAVPVTTGNQVIESMRVSWDGRWLMYDSDLRGNSDVYRIPLDRSAPPEQLTSDSAEEFAPDLSPDGKFLVYHSWRSGTRDVEVKPLDGGPIEQITNTPASESYPRWSPDGTSLLYYDQNSRSLFVRRREANGGWSPPAHVGGPPAQRPVWSPDGREIAYTTGSGPNRPGKIHVRTLATGRVRELFQPAANAPLAGALEWSPDGKTIYYKYHDERGLTSFWSVSAGGGRPRLIMRMPDPHRQSRRADFASDGKRLFFAIEDRQSDVFTAELVAKR